MNFFSKTKDPSNFATSSVEMSNSAVNLAGNINSLSRSINSIFNNDSDIINQDMNIMTSNHYISGYQIVPMPLPPRIPAPPDPMNAINSVLDSVMNFDQDIRTQPMVDYDVENFKYSLDRQTDNKDFYYEDPLFVSFDLFFDDSMSPLFNGEVDNFFNTYTNGDWNSLMNAWDNYHTFINLFWRIFNRQFKEDNGANEKKNNKPWYINSISGLDEITAKIPKYTEDKLTITLSEDVTMMMGYMVDAYNNFIYNFRDQRYNLPDNLLRFKMMIRFTDLRTMKLVNHFETPDYIYDKATQIYSLYDCNFDFFNSKDFTNEVTVGGYDTATNNTPATLKFDIIYKSIQKEIRTPLLRDAKNKIINNKELDDPSLVSAMSVSLTTTFRDLLSRSKERENELKDILKNAFGAVNLVNNMLQNFIPKFKPPIPILPPDILGVSYDNPGYVNHNINQEFEVVDPLQSRKDLIDKFTKLMTKLPLRNIRKVSPNLGFKYVNPRKGNLKPLGDVYKQITTTPRQTPLGYDYRNDGTPTHGDLGFISLFLKPPFINPLGSLFQNIILPPIDDLGYDYENDGTPTHGDLGNDFINTGVRPLMPNISLFDKKITEPSNLGYVFTNLYELRSVSLGIDYDNTTERNMIPLNTLYNNFVEKEQVELGTDYVNLEPNDTKQNLGTDYINVSDKQTIELNTLYQPVEKQSTTDMGQVFTGTQKPEVTDMGEVFKGTQKPNTENMGIVFTETQKSNIEDMGTVFTGTQKPEVTDMGEVFRGTQKPEVTDMGEVFTGTQKPETINMGEVFTGTKKPETMDMGEVYIGKQKDRMDTEQEDMGKVFNNKEMKSSDNDLGQVFINKKEKETDLDLGNVFSNTKLLFPNDEELGKTYENNIAEE